MYLASSRSLLRAATDSRAALHEASLALIRSVYPVPRGIRLVGVTVSNFVAASQENEIGLLQLATAS